MQLTRCPSTSGRAFEEGAQLVGVSPVVAELEQGRLHDEPPRFGGLCLDERHAGRRSWVRVNETEALRLQADPLECLEQPLEVA